MRDLAMFLAGGFTFLVLAALAFGIAGELYFPNNGFFGAGDSRDRTSEPDEAAEPERHIQVLSAEDAARHASL